MRGMSRPSTKLRKLEFEVFRSKAPFEADTRVLVAVSGGADSVALLHLLKALQPRWSFELEVAHIHHGKALSEIQNRYRSRAAKKVQAIAAALETPCTILTATPRAQSEAALREARLEVLRAHASKTGATVLVFGHHADDLLETRLIRLLRGTGPEGLKAMQVFAPAQAGIAVWRPLLQSLRADIEDYLDEKNLKKGRDWLEDPSNRDERYLRNAIRRQLIPLIEKIRPGGTAAVKRSLELLADHVAADAAVTDTPDEMSSVAEELNRAELLALSPENRRKCLANWLRSRKIKGISKSHIEEVLKRIDTPRKRLTFKTGGYNWTVERTIRCASQSSQV